MSCVYADSMLKFIDWLKKDKQSAKSYIFEVFVFSILDYCLHMYNESIF